MWREHATRPGAVQSRARAPARPSGATGTRPSARPARLRTAGRGRRHRRAVAIADRKPDHVKARVKITDDYVRLKRTMRDLDLVTVCEEAGCPNIFECWADGTATFMVAGERCTRKCGFCLVDTRKPEPLDAGEPDRVAEAVERMGLTFAVITMVARDDLADGAAAHVAATVAAIRAGGRRASGSRRSSPTARATPAALDLIFAARPDVLNHNIESVARLQRAVRPSAGYARSLAVLARAKAAGLTTKSSIIVGMGETDDEVVQTLADLRAVGVDIVTIGQYLRPTTQPPAGRPLGRAGAVRACGSASARPWASATSRHRRSPGRATTPARPPTHATAPSEVPVQIAR